MISSYWMTQRRVWDPLLDPSLSSGLILDLCPSYSATVTLNGSTVSSIKDRSTYANHFSQATSGKQPTYNVTDANYGKRASISFSGAQEMQSTSPVLGLGGSGSVTHAIVYRGTASGSALYQMGVVFPPTKGDLADFNTTTTVRQLGYRSTLQTNYSVASALNTTYRSAFIFDVSGASCVGTHYRNGVQVGTNTGAAGTGTTFGSGDNWMLGSTFGSNYFNGTIVRFLSWNRTLSSTELTNLDNGLKSFFFL